MTTETAGDSPADPDSPPASTSSNRWRVPLSDVRLPPAAIEAAREVLASGWLSSGPRVAAFEREVAAYAGARHAVACSSGTAALELAYRVLDLSPGDEVLMPSLTFVAGANTARLRGVEPVLCDVVGEDDLTIDAGSIRRQATDRARAVVLMHYGGHPCRPEAVATARELGLSVVEDAAHALGAEGEGGPCGAQGDLGCFSFFANKNLPLGEGGMLVTDDSELAERALRLRSHGMTSASWERHTGAATSYDVRAAGHNFRFDEARAAMGTAMLGELPALDRRRGELAARYRERLAAIDGVTVPFGDRPTGERSAHHLAVAALARGTDRDEVAAALAADGVQTSVHYPPTHRFSAYTGTRADVARTEALADRLLTLPLHPHLGDEEVDLVVDSLARALGVSS
jgi:dTDP-4-amino-4,6-dideoxygalactose transaminase